ncbi:DUF1566 domain-containing protein [Thiomicrorhabdus aquaedulcis]|uniref:Lcl domain-containing protein n=1 Tax=Thiomicrorhabdus aquaedulcis TaxID=2211106 RepID=UPI000FD6F538|nr:DUF1566 domain-containing protein [Thiomicrorhabdus aquaedulcis]
MLKRLSSFSGGLGLLLVGLIPEASASLTLTAQNLVYDTQQNLIWQACPQGQTLNNMRCEGTPSLLSWHQAMQPVNMASHSASWHLPTQVELINYLKQWHQQQQNGPLFANTILSKNYPGFYWTSTLGNGYQTGAWGVYANTQSARFYFRKTTGWVLLVKQV